VAALHVAFSHLRQQLLDSFSLRGRVHIQLHFQRVDPLLHVGAMFRQARPQNVDAQRRQRGRCLERSQQLHAEPFVCRSGVRRQQPIQFQWSGRFNGRTQPFQLVRSERRVGQRVHSGRARAGRTLHRNYVEK
jgi:hypothetical protein